MKTKRLVLLFILCFIVEVKAQTNSMSSGSGIVLSTNGYIATNNHVVDGGIEFFVDVFTNGIKKSYKASVSCLTMLIMPKLFLVPFYTKPYLFRSNCLWNI